MKEKGYVDVYFDILELAMWKKTLQQGSLEPEVWTKKVTLMLRVGLLRVGCNIAPKLGQSWLQFITNPTFMCDS